MPTHLNIADKPVEVRANAGVIDTATAALRLLTVVLTTVPILLTLIGARDLVGFITYLQGEDGIALAAAVSGLAAIGYGLFKSHRRGAQIATVAADRRTPDAVAKIK